MTTGYLVSSLVWIAVGFGGGYAFGRHLDGRRDVTDPAPAPPRRDRLLRWVRRNALGVLALLVVAATGALYAQQSVALSRATECQAAYNQAYVLALKERSDAAAEERQAQRTLLATILANPGNHEVGRRALDDYLASLARADSEREQNPIPTSTCAS